MDPSSYTATDLDARPMCAARASSRMQRLRKYYQLRNCSRTGATRPPALFRGWEHVRGGGRSRETSFLSHTHRPRCTRHARCTGSLAGAPSENIRSIENLLADGSNPYTRTF